MNQQKITKAPNELSCITNSDCSKDVQQQEEWNFGHGVGAGIGLPCYAIVDFQQKEWLEN